MYAPMQPHMAHTGPSTFGQKVSDHMVKRGKPPLEPPLINALNASAAEAIKALRENKKVIVENVQLAAQWFQAWGKAEGEDRRLIFRLGPLNYAKKTGTYPEGRTPKEDAELVRTCRDTLRDLMKKER